MDANIQTNMDLFSDLSGFFWGEAIENEFTCQTDPLTGMGWPEAGFDIEHLTVTVEAEKTLLDSSPVDNKVIRNRRSTRSTPLEVRKEIIRLREQEALQFSTIAARLNIPATTVKSIWKVYRREKRVDAKTGGGWDQSPGRTTIAKRITEPVRARILELRAGMTSLRAISECIWREYGVYISRSSCRTLLQQ